MKNQKTINKILVGILIVLVVFIGYSRFTEQSRVDYYICYKQHTDMTSSPDLEKIRDYCKERN